MDYENLLENYLNTEKCSILVKEVYSNIDFSMFEVSLSHNNVNVKHKISISNYLLNEFVALKKYNIAITQMRIDTRNNEFFEAVVFNTLSNCDPNDRKKLETDKYENDGNLMLNEACDFTAYRIYKMIVNLKNKESNI
jgi:hypothetical protein